VATLDSTGLTTETLQEILDQIEADEKAEISTSLDLSTSSPLGQLNRLLARALRVQEEALQAVFTALDPDSASGEALTRLSAITGTIRRAATFSRVEAECDLDVDTYPAGTLIVAPTGRPDDRFANVEEITGLGSGTPVLFEALTAGAVLVAANVLEIASPVTGFNSVESNDEATPGLAAETDSELRQRRTQEIEAPGSASVPGIATDITQNVDGVISAYVVENATDATVDSIPPHAFEAVVYGPASPSTADNQAVAEQIFASKAAGIGTYGNISRTVTDSEGRSHVISFTRPVDVDLTITITVSTRAGAYAGDTELAEHIATRALEDLTPGLDVSGSMLAAWAHEVRGVLRVTSVTINAGSAWAVFAITSRQIARISAVDVSVTSAGATP
jgi:uncharacterized phage protein gp47/JayE